MTGKSPDRKSPLTVVALIVALVVVLLLDAYATYTVFTSKYPGANDFYSRWAGGRAFLVEGKNPYSEEVTRQIQLGIYGRLARPDEDQVAFAYPLYTVYLVAPFSLIPSYPMAQALWQAVLEFTLLFAIFCAIGLYRWRVRPWLLAVTCLWGILFYPGARSIILGQFSIVVLAFIVAALWAIKEDKDVLAGLCLAFSTVKPQMVFLVIPLLMLWGLYRRRWRLALSFLGWMAFLLASSLLLLPGWIGDFLAWMSRYPSYTEIGSPLWTLTNYFFPFLGAPVHLGLSGLLVGYMLYTWRGIADETANGPTNGRAFDWMVAMTLIITNLIALRTATTNYVVLLLPLFIVFRATTESYRRGAILVALIELALLVGHWALFFATIVGDYEHPIMYLPLPLGLWIVFVAARRWLVRDWRIGSRE